MKKIFLFIALCIMINSYSQNDWTKKSYGSLKYSYPKNWTELKYQSVNGKSTYGSQYFDLGKTSQFTVLEIPNDTGIVDAHKIPEEEIKNFFKNLFSPTSNFNLIENRTLSNINAKYIKATAVTSKGLKLTTIAYVIFYKTKMIIVQGIFTSENESEFLPTVNKIISTTKTI